MAQQVVELTGASTVNGQRVDIKTDDSGVMVDGAKVVTTDIKCDNGVIHVVDKVIATSSFLSDTIAGKACDAALSRTPSALRWKSRSRT